MTSRAWIRIVIGAWALALSACASSFERDWKTAAQRVAVSQKGDPFGGAWDGVWTSEKHRLPSGKDAGGRLRCIFTKMDERHYQARFSAGWLIFTTNYESTFETQLRDGVLTFRGEHDLGAIFGGVYRYDGRVTPQHFSAGFTAKSDHGRFEMNRVAPAAGEVRLPARVH